MLSTLTGGHEVFMTQLVIDDDVQMNGMILPSTFTSDRLLLSFSPPMLTPKRRFHRESITECRPVPLVILVKAIMADKNIPSLY
jgi:hypothetical protein